ncbi:hypothetical protein DFP72DRAFT_856871 [Ephemerocybe angulata]|uniref:PARP-type domain-containing protein n=1 Tax=Ephemerocybe angulata TaxID=980116 RepID=A0A8H6HEV5_9AGAR|nr:hypothetical protein DFP72DRAFT_856871 [Tulosesus angulatus]
MWTASSCYYLAYAPTSRAKCVGHVPTLRATKIAKGELRLGSSNSLIPHSPNKPLTSWKHWTCVSSETISSMRLQYGDITTIPGYATLTPDDKERVRVTWNEAGVYRGTTEDSEEQPIV